MEQDTKGALLYEHGIEPLINILLKDKVEEDRELVSSAIYALGSLCENEDVKANIVELKAISPIVMHASVGDMEIKRAAGYFLATICEQV